MLENGCFDIEPGQRAKQSLASCESDAAHP
jgi:hypothetical protein